MTCIHKEVGNNGNVAVKCSTCNRKLQMTDSQINNNLHMLILEIYALFQQLCSRRYRQPITITQVSCYVQKAAVPLINMDIISRHVEKLEETTEFKSSSCLSTNQALAIPFSCSLTSWYVKFDLEYVNCIQADF